MTQEQVQAWTEEAVSGGSAGGSLCYPDDIDYFFSVELCYRFALTLEYHL